MLLIRISTFIKSLVWHVSRGLPKSSKDTIASRYSLCIACDSYDKENKQCSQCGCNISNKSIFLNKLAWADQKCPLNKW
jgi:hypothetical protein